MNQDDYQKVVDALVKAQLEHSECMDQELVVIHQMLTRYGKMMEIMKKQLDALDAALPGVLLRLNSLDDTVDV